MRNFWFIAVATILIGCGDVVQKSTTSLSDVILKLPISDSTDIKYDTIALGKIIEGEVVKSSFEVRNISSQPLVIVNVITGCGCTSINYDAAPIMAGDVRRFDFEFNSQGRVGWQIKAIELLDANNNVGKVFISAQVDRAQN